MTKMGTNIFMRMAKKGLSKTKRSTMNQISKPVIIAAPIILKILIVSSQHFNSI